MRDEREGEEEGGMRDEVSDLDEPPEIPVRVIKSEGIGCLGLVFFLEDDGEVQDAVAG